MQSIRMKTINKLVIEPTYLPNNHIYIKATQSLAAGIRQLLLNPSYIFRGK